MASGFNSAVARTGGLIATALLGVVLARDGEGLFAGFHIALVGSAVAAAGREPRRAVPARRCEDAEGVARRALTLHRNLISGRVQRLRREVAMDYTAQTAGAGLGGRNADGRDPGRRLILRHSWPCSTRRSRLRSLCGGTRGSHRCAPGSLSAAAAVGAQARQAAAVRSMAALARSTSRSPPPTRRRSAISTRGLGFAYGFNHAGAIAVLP